MSRPAPAPEARFAPMTTAALPTVLAIENRCYTHPWTQGNFADALRAGYEAQLLLGANQLLGYFVAMQGVDEVHLLNITVAPEVQGQGWARLMLDALTLWSRARHAQWLWLEVRASHARAQRIYQSHGFRPVAVRPRYYPLADGTREDAIVMSQAL